MSTIISAITGLEMFFAMCALLGGGLFLVRLVLMFIGLGHHDAGDTGSAGAIGNGSGLHGGGSDLHHNASDSDVSFKTLSLQGITAFFMMFGLVGWAMLRQSGFPAIFSLLVGFGAGVLTIWLIKKIFQFAGRLQSSGTLNLYNAVGQEGTVYLTIHPGQEGKIQVIVQEQLMTLDACSDSPEELKTGQRVIVVGVRNNILFVEKPQL